MSTLHHLFGRLKLQLRGKHHVVGWSMTPDEVISFFKSLRKTILTFYGYSGLGYKDEKGMLQIAKDVLSEYSPETTLVNIGVTSVGIRSNLSTGKINGLRNSRDRYQPGA